MKRIEDNDDNVRDLHVVTELKVGRELQSLRHGDVPPGLEHHHRHGLPGERVANDQLSNNVEPDLLVGDRLDHAYRDDVHEGDDLRAGILRVSGREMAEGNERGTYQREDEGPDGHLRRPDLDGDDTEDEHGHCRERARHERGLRSQDTRHGLQKMIAYHQSGTCGYFDIRRAWISGCSCMALRDCVQICLR